MNNYFWTNLKMTVICITKILLKNYHYVVWKMDCNY